MEGRRPSVDTEILGGAWLSCREAATQMCLWEPRSRKRALSEATGLGEKWFSEGFLINNVLTASVSPQPKMKSEQWTILGSHEAKGGPWGGDQMTLL